MKINRQALSGALSQCGKAISGRTTIPILDQVFCEAVSGTLTLRATNLDVWVERHLDCEGDFAACYVNFDTLSQLVSLAASESVAMERKGQRAILTAGSAVNTLSIMKTDEPLLLPKDGRPIAVPVGILADGIEAVAWLPNADHPADVTNAMKANVTVQISTDAIDCLSFTGTVLAHFGQGLVPGFQPETFLIPYKFAPFLAPVLRESNASVTASDNAIHVKSDGGTVCVKLAEGKVTDWRSLIDSTSGRMSLFGIAPLLLAAQRAQVIYGGDPYPRMTMELTGETLTIESQSGNKTSESIPFKSAPGRISVNARLLANSLKQFDGDTAECVIAKNGSKWRSGDLEILIWHLAPEKEITKTLEDELEAPTPEPKANETSTQPALI